MAKCQECGNFVSSLAKSCPHCGRPYPAGGAGRWVNILVDRNKKKRRNLFD